MDEFNRLGTKVDPISVDMPAESARRDGMFRSAPPQVAEEDCEYHAVMHTDRGDIFVRLFAAEAPVTVNNFIYLALTGFYDDTMFHRVIKGFMAQGGDPSGTGRGGPGYRFKDEFTPNLTFDSPYLLAMANAGPGTNGSQFFITFAPTPHLNNNHTIFGKVTSGQEAVDSISARDPMAARQPGDSVSGISIYVKTATD